MEQQYLQELFSFQAELQFRDPGSGIFQMEPTEDCVQTLLSYGLHFKPKDDGFGVMAPFILHQDTGLMELKNQFNENVKLSFAVFTKEPDFFAQAQLPEDPPGEYVYYLNNLNENERRTQLLITDNCGIKVSERVKLHSKQISGPVIKNAIPPKVFDLRGNQIPNTRYDFSVDSLLNTYTIDLSRMADGLFTIEYNNERNTYYCAKASFIRRIPLLILEIFTDPNLNEKCRVAKLVNGIQYLDPKQFGLHFGNYSYYWKYVIIPVNIPQCTWLRTQSNNSQYSFIPEKVKVMNLDPIIFTSTSVIDTPNAALTISLYRQNWSTDCRLSSQKYKDCNQDYWIEVSSAYWCRYKDNYGNYKYKCPARYVDELIGPLPKPGEAYTKYSVEDGKQYAQMTLYLVKENNQYLLKPTDDPTGEFTYKIFGDHGDLTIQFINNVVVVKVTVHYEIPGRMGRRHFHMQRIGGIYSMEHLFHRVFPYLRMNKGDTINYSFTYELSNKQQITSATHTYVVNE